MQYRKIVPIKGGRTCLLRNATEADGEEVYRFFHLTHGQTDFLLAYPDESSFDVAGEKRFLADLEAKDNAIMLCAYVDGVLAGTLGMTPIGMKTKLRHRAEFGITVEQSFQGQGIGRALMNACIECAKQAGYLQLELEAVADNVPALTLYKSAGFQEYGRNPRGFRTRDNRWQELVLMRLELDS